MFNVIDTFKKMFKQKMKEMEKAYEKQVKELKAKKASGQSKKSAVSICFVFMPNFMSWSSN